VFELPRVLFMNEWVRRHPSSVPSEFRSRVRMLPETHDRQEWNRNVEDLLLDERLRSVEWILARNQFRWEIWGNDWQAVVVVTPQLLVIPGSKKKSSAQIHWFLRTCRTEVSIGKEILDLSRSVTHTIQPHWRWLEAMGFESILNKRSPCSVVSFCARCHNKCVHRTLLGLAQYHWKYEHFGITLK